MNDVRQTLGRLAGCIPTWRIGCATSALFALAACGSSASSLGAGGPAAAATSAEAAIHAGATTAAAAKTTAAAVTTKISSGTGSMSSQPMGTAAAARLLMQGTMGTSLTDLNTAAGESYGAWFAAQAAAAPSLELPRVNNQADDTRLSAWWYNAVNGRDQLRQRMAFALSELFVVSNVNDAVGDQAQALATYYDLLATNALGNFRTLFGAVSTSPVMGLYLTYFKNQLPNPATGVQADENYAREVMQLFTIGLWQLNPNGTQKLDGSGDPIATYTQTDVSNLADVFTGWGSHRASGETAVAAWNERDLLDPMTCDAEHHDTSAKTIVGGVAIPAGGTCVSELAIALDTLFNHPNTAPFISKQLIQRLVTSNPSPAYVARVAAVFANDGQGVRGDLLAVAEAILTDPEAVTLGTAAGSGKLREPVLRLTGMWRAFSASESGGSILVNITHSASGVFGENALDSPTVFNFFAPTYQRAGPLAAAGLVVPEFQITNENTIVLTANTLQLQAYDFVDSHGVVSTSTAGAAVTNPMLLHTASWEAYASNASTLVSQLALVFMPGQMPAAMNATLVGYVNAIPATSPASRVIEAASLLLSSPQYSVQR
jgi:uncharacterized protein (DUF1800 family)